MFITRLTILEKTKQNKSKQKTKQKKNKKQKTTFCKLKKFQFFYFLEWVFPLKCSAQNIDFFLSNLVIYTFNVTYSELVETLFCELNISAILAFNFAKLEVLLLPYL